MRRTISIRLEVSAEQITKLLELQAAYLTACNEIAPTVVEHRCWNRVGLHNLVYSKIRANSLLGSQMVCNAIFSVCKAYKNKTILKEEAIPRVQFRKNRSIHFDKRTYSLKGEKLSLYTLDKRIVVSMKMGEFQKGYFSKGVPKEGELIHRKGKWYFNLVLDLPETESIGKKSVIAVDLGENVIAATSSGKLFGGGKIRFERDQYLAKRRSLQSNGSQSAKQLLKKISGKEARRMKQINHEVSKQIVQEAMKQEAGTLVLENLKNIRKRIKRGKRIRIRLHRWSFFQLQTMIQYKAESQGLTMMYVNPAYSSQECSHCGCLGVRQKHLFTCSCGNQQHSDLNASRNLCRFAQPIGYATCAVNRTQVAAKC
jgi:putative transposase